jgi:hypothetical protein
VPDIVIDSPWPHLLSLPQLAVIDAEASTHGAVTVKLFVPEAGLLPTFPEVSAASA